jgi:hypothetical protein
VAAAGAFALAFFMLGRARSVSAQQPGAPANAELAELRAELERQKNALRLTDQRVALGLSAAAAAVAPVAPTPAAAVPPNEPPPSASAQATPYTRADEDRFFRSYFSDLSETVRSQGRDTTRTSSVRSAASAVIQEQNLGRLADVDCSASICRVTIEGVTEEARSKFTAVFTTRMASEFGGGSIESPVGSDRIVGYFSKPNEALPTPLEPLTHRED